MSRSLPRRGRWVESHEPTSWSRHGVGRRRVREPVPPRDLPDGADGGGKNGGRRRPGAPARGRSRRARLDDPLPGDGHRHGQADPGRAGGDSAPPDRRARLLGVGERRPVSRLGTGARRGDRGARPSRPLCRRDGALPQGPPARALRRARGRSRPAPGPGGRGGTAGRGGLARPWLAAVDPAIAARLHPNDRRAWSSGAPRADRGRPAAR